MKKFYSLLLFVLVAATSAIAGPITSSGSGNWNSTVPNAPWPGGVVPASTDDVSIRPGDNITVTANATINSIIFLGTSATNRTLTVNSGVVLTVTTSITLDNAIANNTLATLAGAGTINCASLKVGGTVTTGFTADRTIGLTSTLTALNISGNLTVRSEDEVSNQANATFTHTSGIVTVSGSVVIDAENDGAGTSSGSATYTMNGGGAETGTLDLPGATPFSTPGTGTVTFDANGTSATVIYSGGAQTVRATAYRNLTLSGSGTKTMTGVGTINNNLTLSGTVDATTAAAFSVGGAINVGTGTTFTVAGFNFGVTGTTTIDGTLVSNSTTGTKSFDNIIVNNGGVFNSSANEDYSISGNLQIGATGSFTAGSGNWTWTANGAFSGTATIANIIVNGGGAVTLTNNGTLTVTSLTGADAFTQGAAGVLNFSGASVGVTTFTASIAGNTVNYTNAAQTVRGTTYSNLTLSGSNTKTLGANTTVNATLSMQGTAALSVGAFTLTYGASSTLEYAGSAAQTTTSVEFKTPGGPTNLKINNSNGVTLHAARTIAGVVTFTTGILNTTATNLLIVNSTGSVTGASDASFVDGPIKKIGAIGAGGFDFPVGKAGVGYMKITIANVTGPTTEFTARYFRASAAFTFDTVGLSAIGLQAVSNCEYWTLDRAVTSATADVTLSWNSHSGCNGSYLSDPLFGIRIAHFNGSIWDAHGGGSPSGDASAGSITWSGVSSFSPFALAALVGSQSSLPVMFYDVKAYERNRGVQVEWTNLTERDLIRYTVERSTNGQSYTQIAEQYPRSNTNDKESYSAFDATPSSVNYYRVKAYEISGKIVYSKVMKVEVGKSSQGFSIYPNPVTGHQVSVTMNMKQGQYVAKVINAAGQVVYNVKLNHQGGSMTQAIDIPSNIKPGVYNMMISGDNYRESKLFVVQ